MLTRISLHGVIHKIPGDIREDLRRSPLDSTFVQIKTESWVNGWGPWLRIRKTLLKELNDANASR